MFSSYLITGGLGSIGSAVVAGIFETTADATITVLDNLTGSGDLSRLPLEVRNSPRFLLVRGDVANEILVQKTLEDRQVDCLLDCSTRGSSSIARSPLAGARNAIQGITHLLDAVRYYGKLKSFVLVSTQQVYGSSSQSELSPLCPTTFYGAALMGAEAMLHSYVISYRLPLTTVRLTDGIIENVVEKIKNNREVPSILSLLPLSDAVTGILKAASGANMGSVYNIGGEDYRLEDIEKVVSGDFSSFSPVGSSFPISEAEKDLGFVPTKDVREALSACCSVRPAPSISGSAKFVVYGADGWVGTEFLAVLQRRDVAYETAQTVPGVDSDSAVLSELSTMAPSHVVSFLGRSDEQRDSAFTEPGSLSLYRESREDLLSPWLLASFCDRLGIHFTHVGSGSMFDAQVDEITESQNGSSEASTFAVVKSYAERLLRHFPDFLQVRITNPISVNDIETENKAVLTELESATYVEDCLPILLDLALKRERGVLNLVSPLALSMAEMDSVLGKPSVPKEHRRLSTKRVQSLAPSIRTTAAILIDQKCSK